jgi:ubiquinone/menaquinone biosynthesis C-methylase UbiE
LKNTITNKDFFNQLAPEYDQMISFEKSIENKKKILAKFINPEMKIAADLGCGTGVDSIALSSLGLKIDAFDPSSEMIKLAKENAVREGFKVDYNNYPIDSIPEKFKDKFHFTISLGNTFANIEKKKFSISIEKCFNILKKGGTLLMQILNYEKVLLDKQRIVNITEWHRKYFIRFYDFINDEIIFNILTFGKEKPFEHKIISTKLFPYNQNDFKNELENSGFTSIEFFSDFNLSTFNTKQSKDLIIKAVKS